MTHEDQIHLADWLLHMQDQFDRLKGDPTVQQHIDFLKRCEQWVRLSLKTAQGKLNAEG